MNKPVTAWAIKLSNGAEISPMTIRATEQDCIESFGRELLEKWPTHYSCVKVTITEVEK